MKLETTHQSWRAAAAVGIAIGVTLSLGACSSGSGTSTDEEKLILWDYQQEPGAEYLKRLTDYTAETGIEVERVAIKYEDFLGKILQAAAANSLPDVIMIDNPWNSAMAAEGVLLDLTDRVEEWGQWDQYFDGPAESATWDGKIYGVPNESNDLIMYYDKTVFDEAGLAAPTTWEELRSAAEQLTTADRYGFSTSMIKSENSVFVFESLLWQAGADLDSLDSPEALEAMEFLKSLQDSGAMSKEVLSWDLRGGVTELVNGRSAIAFGGTWDGGWIEENMDNELGIALLPAGPAGQASNLGGENWAITATSKHADAAWDLVTFAVDPEQSLPYLVESGQLPSRRDIAEEQAFTQEPFATYIEQLAVARARVYGPEYPRMADALTTAFQSVLSGQEGSEAALQEAANTIQPLLAE
ncbi:ABC transporter substrate-binding protein [Microbacterium sp. NPDC078428]|uniref:ABC transporter substrate-binding protein n=1 Tax=Microbacterium sp. NPDC078428 TaxID=3364190 RepID=UPI0037C5D2B5